MSRIISYRYKYFQHNSQFLLQIIKLKITNIFRRRSQLYTIIEGVMLQEEIIPLLKRLEIYQNLLEEKFDIFSSDQVAQVSVMLHRERISAPQQQGFLIHQLVFYHLHCLYLRVLHQYEMIQAMLLNKSLVSYPVILLTLTLFNCIITEEILVNITIFVHIRPLGVIRPATHILVRHQ